MIKKSLFRILLIISVPCFVSAGGNFVFAKTNTSEDFLNAIQKENECISAVYTKYQGALEVARCKCWPDQPNCLRPPGEDPSCPEKYVPELEQELEQCQMITNQGNDTPSSLNIIQTPEGNFYDIYINKIGRFVLPVGQKVIGATALIVTITYVVCRKFKINKKTIPIIIGLGLVGVLLLVVGDIKLKNRKESSQGFEIGVDSGEVQKAIDAVMAIKEVQDFKRLVEENGQSNFGIEVAAFPTEETPFYLVQVHESFPDHLTTFGWYRYDPNTKSVTKDLPE